MRKKRTVFVIMVFILLQTVFIIPSLAADSPQKKDPAIAILFTNDVHCYYDRDIGYDGLVLYAKELEQQYEHVILVDAGDAIQGAPIGAISKGKEFIRIMNEAGYDIAILGNHEFDYGFEVLDDLGEQLECGYICANFCTSDGETVYDPYRILECGDTKVAFISVDTPDTFSKSKIRDMVDDQGVPMYDFKSDESGETLYACLQGYIDDVKEKGADYVILVAHLGDGEDATQAYRSNEVVAHLTGLDAVIDGHSHNTYNTTAADAEGKEIPLVQTGASRESQDRTGAGQTENGFSTAERSASGEIPPRAPLPGLNPADKVIRVYDDRGVFYGLYVKKQRQNRFTAYKMFLPEG